MNVCILATARSSSNSLFHTISLLRSFENQYCEPFPWKYEHISELVFSENVLLKQLYSNYALSKDFNSKDDLLQWIKRNFEKVICLYREDTMSQAESLAYHVFFDKAKTEGGLWWHKPKLIDISTIPYRKLLKFKAEYEDFNETLITFGKKEKYFIAKYEDLILSEGNNDTFKRICQYIKVDFNYDKIYEWYRKEKKVSTKIENILPVNKLI